MSLVVARRLYAPGRSGGALTLSGNEITDAVRVAATEGDGRDPEGSMGVWPEVTNNVLNSGAETNATNIVSTGSCTVTRDTTQFKFGVAAAKAVTGNVAVNEGVRFKSTAASAAVGQTHSVSAWIFHNKGSDLNLRLTAAQRTAADGTVNDNNNTTANIPTGVWTRMTLKTAALDATVDSLSVKVMTVAQEAATFWVDGAMSFQGYLQNQPSVHTDGAGVTRAAGSILVPAAGLFSPRIFWAAFRLRTGEANMGQNRRLLRWDSGGTNTILARYLFATTQWTLNRTSGVGGAVNFTSSITAGGLTTVVLAGEPEQLKLSVDGAPFQAAANSDIPTITAANLELLYDSGTATVELGADCFWALFGRGMLTNADAERIKGFGNNDPQVGNMPREWGVTGVFDGRSRGFTRVEG